jgi:hypothetical protein
MASIAVLERRRVHIKMRLSTFNLTEVQRLDLERELWSAYSIIKSTTTVYTKEVVAYIS